MLRAPFGSEFDPSEEAEGSIDPLGLAPGYERLADRLLPAVTVRMGHPRFVTAMAVGACVCDDWDTDAVAADEITPPWLVWKWFVIEAFVRAEDSLSGISGIPGIQKVRRALRNQRPVSATAYLKTPTAFGFTGVFRRLARGIGILTDDGALDDGGYELVSAWAKDQGLDGIIDASGGDGRAFRDRLRRAVGDVEMPTGDVWPSREERIYIPQNALVPNRVVGEANDPPSSDAATPKAKNTPSQGPSPASTGQCDGLESSLRPQ